MTPSEAMKKLAKQYRSSEPEADALKETLERAEVAERKITDLEVHLNELRGQLQRNAEANRVLDYNHQRKRATLDALLEDKAVAAGVDRLLEEDSDIGGLGHADMRAAIQAALAVARKEAKVKVDEPRRT